MASKSLENKRVVVTRSAEQAGPLVEALEARGAEVLPVPLIEVKGKKDVETLEDVFGEIGGYEWVIFTSTNGVKYFFEYFFEKYQDIRCIGGMRIACVGQATRESVEAFHLQVDMTPETQNADALVEALLEAETIENEKFLVVTGNLNRTDLVETLEGKGRAIVDTLQVYETLKTDLKGMASAEAFRKGGADAIVFSSSSTARHFVEQAGDLALAEGLASPKTVSIGPATSETMREIGLPVGIEAAEASQEGIVKALEKLLGA